MKLSLAQSLLLFLLLSCQENASYLVTVTGKIPASTAGITLAHEHILVDFIGADSIRPGRYNPDTVFHHVLPYLLELKPLGIQTFFEFTPNYLGRDVMLLKRLAEASGLNIITNTGYYGAVGEKYLPSHAHTETAEQLAQRWVEEFNNGIDGTGIRPGFIKLSADQAPLTEAQKKIMKAGAITHLNTGLTIAVHSGDGNAAKEELAIFMANGVAPDAFIWVHAQNEKNFEVFKEMASQGVWVEFDYVHPETIEQYVSFLKFMKANNLLHRTLLSHDAGWYDVVDPQSITFRGYTAISTLLIPRLKEEGFTENEIDLLIRKNPAKAFSVQVKKK